MTSTDAPAPAALTRPAPAVWPWWAFRVASTLAAIMLFDQAVFAGQFLAGTYDSLRVHRENATFAGLAMLAAMLASVLLRVVARGPRWPIAACLVVFMLVGAQIALGFARVIGVHVPLGVAIIVAAIALAAWSFRAGP